jgi:hypothetical protein
MIHRLTDEERRIIYSRARAALIEAVNSGIHFEMDDLVAEGYMTYVRAQRRYDRGRGVAQFSSYLFGLLNNSYRNLLRNARTHKRRARLVPYDPEKHDAEAPAGEVEYAELVEYYCDMLTRKIDKEVLYEKAYPSEQTVTLALVNQLRCAHLVRLRVPIGRSDASRPIITNDVLARSLRYSPEQIKKALSRIKRTIDENK